MSICSEESFVNVSPLISGEKEMIAFSRSFDEKINENGIEVSSFLFEGEFRGKGKDLTLSGSVSFTAFAPCARCLNPCSENFKCDFSLPVLTPLDAEDEDEMSDFALVENDKVDIFSVGYEKLILNLPFRLLCNENCKGFCSKCGKDLNQGECSCSDNEIDPRLAGLSDFFK